VIVDKRVCNLFGLLSSAYLSGVGYVNCFKDSLFLNLESQYTTGANNDTMHPLFATRYTGMELLLNEL
jgi:hypothetical protein